MDLLLICGPIYPQKIILPKAKLKRNLGRLFIGEKPDHVCEDKITGEKFFLPMIIASRFFHVPQKASKHSCLQRDFHQNHHRCQILYYYKSTPIQSSTKLCVFAASTTTTWGTYHHISSTILFFSNLLEYYYYCCCFHTLIEKNHKKSLIKKCIRF